MLPGLGARPAGGAETLAARAARDRDAALSGELAASGLLAMDGWPTFWNIAAARGLVSHAGVSCREFEIQDLSRKR